jgi:transposase
VIDGVLSIDVSKNALDVSMSGCNKIRARSFVNSAHGGRHLLDWLVTQKIQRVHACLESTGRFSLGIACALHEAGHVVSIVNPAQIRDFARTKLDRNKTDGVDASHFREYCELFKPQPGTPPSNARRALGELQTIRAGIIAGLTQWKNRRNSGMVNAVAQSLADVTIAHFASQLEALDEAVAQTIDDDRDLRRQCELLLSIGGVGETLAGVVLAELPGPNVLRSSSEVVERGSLGVREHHSAFQRFSVARYSFSGRQLLVHRPCDVGQDGRPIPNRLFAPIPCGGDRPKNVPEHLRHRYAGRGQLTVLSVLVS